MSRILVFIRWRVTDGLASCSRSSQLRCCSCSCCVHFHFPCSGLWIHPSRKPLRLPDGGDSTTTTTLVVIIGSLRGGEMSWQSMYKHVLDENNADLALMIGEGGNKSLTPYLRAKYVWEFLEYGDWADAIDQIDGPEWRTTVQPSYRCKKMRHCWGVSQGISAVVPLSSWHGIGCYNESTSSNCSRSTTGLC
jgi:hypothetical protein